MTTAVEPVHICWSYDDHRPFEAYAQKALSRALSAGERVWYVPGPRTGATADWLRTVASGRPGAARVISLGDAYLGDQAVDPAGQVAAYTAATEEALAAGFTGFRVVADATGLVRTDAQRDAFARYEFVIGRYMRNAPMRAVCAYDRVELGERAVAELACMHQGAQSDETIFQLHPGVTDALVVLDGEVDMAAEDLFTEALHRTDLRPAGGEIVVDAAGLRFADHRALLALQHFAEARGSTAVVRTRLGTVARLAELLGLSRVRAEIVR